MLITKKENVLWPLIVEFVLDTFGIRLVIYETIYINCPNILMYAKSYKKNSRNPIGMSAYSILRQPNMRVREEISCAHEGITDLADVLSFDKYKSI